METVYKSKDGKYYKTVEACEAADKAWDEAHAAEEKAKEERNAMLAEYKELLAAYNEHSAARSEEDKNNREAYWAEHDRLCKEDAEEKAKVQALYNKFVNKYNKMRWEFTTVNDFDQFVNSFLKRMF